MATEELKKMPYSCTKNHFYNMYGKQFPDTVLRREINAIISENRKSEPANLRVKIIRHKELVEFVAIHGLPEGYKNWDE